MEAITQLHPSTALPPTKESACIRQERWMVPKRLGETEIFRSVPGIDVDRDSSVGTATSYGLDGPGIESRWGARFSAPVQTYLGPTQPSV